MAQYTPQVDEPVSFVDGPPPAYPKGYSMRVQLIKLGAKTAVIMIALVGTFILLASYIHSTTSPCECPPFQEFISRSDSEPLIAEPTHGVKLRIGENLRDHKGKSHMDCFVERREQALDAIPPKGDQRLQVKGEQTIISCIANKVILDKHMPKSKRTRRSPICDCNCAC